MLVVFDQNVQGSNFIEVHNLFLVEWWKESDLSEAGWKWEGKTYLENIKFSFNKQINLDLPPLAAAEAVAVNIWIENVWKVD